MLREVKDRFYYYLCLIATIGVWVNILLDEAIAYRKQPGDMNAGCYKLNATQNGLGAATESTSSEIGYAIVAAMIIIGTALLGLGLMKRAQAEQGHDAKGSLMKIGLGSALIVFGLMIGLAIKTLTDNIGSP